MVCPVFSRFLRASLSPPGCLGLTRCYVKAVAEPVPVPEPVGLGVRPRVSVVLVLILGPVPALQLPGVGHQGVAGGRSGSPPLPQPGPLLLLLWLFLLLGGSLPYLLLLGHVLCSCCRSSEAIYAIPSPPVALAAPALQQLLLPLVAPGVLQGGAGGRCGSSPLLQPEPP